MASDPIGEQILRPYMRPYWHFVRVPALDRLFCQLSNLGNRTIVGQHRPVVMTQQPNNTALDTGEKLLPSAREPIIAQGDDW